MFPSSSTVKLQRSLVGGFPPIFVLLDKLWIHFFYVNEAKRALGTRAAQMV